MKKLAVVLIAITVCGGWAAQSTKKPPTVREVLAANGITDVGQLPFSQQVRVTCAPIDQIDQMKCLERAQ